VPNPLALNPLALNPLPLNPSAPGLPADTSLGIGNLRNESGNLL